MALSTFYGKHLDKKAAINLVLSQGWMATDHRNWFHPDLPFYWTDWREDKLPSRYRLGHRIVQARCADQSLPNASAQRRSRLMGTKGLL